MLGSAAFASYLGQKMFNSNLT
jgi:nitrite reductase/ring-hydroxylating ferredoxin subunit